MIESSIQGTINGAKTAAKLGIIMDSSSSIQLTGNSYYTSLNNGDAEGNNINKGSFEWDNYEETTISRPTGNSGGPNDPQNEPFEPNGRKKKIKWKIS